MRVCWSHRSHEFFEQLTEDAAAYASHAGRKSRLHESDLVTMMYRFVYPLHSHPASHSFISFFALPAWDRSLTLISDSLHRQRVLSDTCGLQALGRQHGLDRELLSVIDAMGAGGKGVGKGGKKRKAEGGHEGEKKQRRKSGKGKGKGRESSEEEDAGEGDNGAESQEEENGGDSE